MKEAQAGKAVKEDDIPPAVFIKGASDKLKMEQENESKKVEKETPVESKKPTESTVAQGIEFCPNFVTFFMYSNHMLPY